MTYTHYSDVSVLGKVESARQGKLVGTVTEMPDPAKSYGLTVLYAGTTTDDYIHGRLYQSDSANWQLVKGIVYDVTIGGTSVLDRTGTAIIPADSPQVQADWDVTDMTSKAYIHHKPVVPTALSQLTENEDHVTITEEQRTKLEDAPVITYEQVEI